MEARRGVKVWLYSVLTLAPDGVGAQCHAPAALPTGRGPLHRGEEAELATRQVRMGFAPTGDRHSDRPACIESLYRLRYQRIESNEKFFLRKFYLVQFSVSYPGHGWWAGTWHLSTSAGLRTTSKRGWRPADQKSIVGVKGLSRQILGTRELFLSLTSTD